MFDLKARQLCYVAQTRTMTVSTVYFILHNHNCHNHNCQHFTPVSRDITLYIHHIYHPSPPPTPATCQAMLSLSLKVSHVVIEVVWPVTTRTGQGPGCRGWTPTRGHWPDIWEVTVPINVAQISYSCLARGGRLSHLSKAAGMPA